MMSGVNFPTSCSFILVSAYGRPYQDLRCKHGWTFCRAGKAAAGPLPLRPVDAPGLSSKTLTATSPHENHLLPRSSLLVVPLDRARLDGAEGALCRPRRVCMENRADEPGRFPLVARAVRLVLSAQRHDRTLALSA